MPHNSNAAGIIFGLGLLGLLFFFAFKTSPKSETSSSKKSLLTMGSPSVTYQNTEEWNLILNSDGIPTKLIITRKVTRNE